MPDAGARQSGAQSRTHGPIRRRVGAAGAASVRAAIVAATALAGLGTAGAAVAERVFNCQFAAKGPERTSIPEMIEVRMLPGAGNAMVLDRFTLATSDEGIAARVANTAASRVELNWQAMARHATVSSVMTVYHMTIFPARGEATLSFSWGRNGWESYHVSALGTCAESRM